ncbi:hypothetical protein H9P43_001853 [Blastocladiella emersonii ATCC 22665]|nr:hypothetical protein H9P43_001853 [Blastocladiella emersonii ATCC 22665]
MAEELTRALKSSAVPAAEKLSLAAAAFRNPRLRLPRKAEFLADWLVNLIFKSRTWENLAFDTTPILGPAYWSLLTELLASPALQDLGRSGTPLKAPVFPLLAAAVTAIPANVTESADRETLFGHVDASFRVLAPALATMQKITVDSWADLVRSLCTGAAADDAAQTPSLVALTHAALEAFAKVLTVATPIKKYVAVVTALLPALVSLPVDMHAAVTGVLAAGLFPLEASQDMVKAISTYNDSLRSASGRVESFSNKKARSAPRQASATGATSAILPADLTKALMKLGSRDALRRAQRLLLEVAIDRLSVADPANTSSLTWLAVYEALTEIAADDYDQHTALLEFLSSQDRLRLTDDRDDRLSTALRFAIDVGADTPEALLQRFLVIAEIGIKQAELALPRAIAALANRVEEDPAFAAATAERMIRVYGQARSLNVLFVQLQHGLLTASPAAVTTLLGHASVLSTFADALPSAVSAMWFDVMDVFTTTLDLAASDAVTSILATYVALMLEAVPDQSSLESERTQLAATLAGYTRAHRDSPAALHIHLYAMNALPQYAAAWPATELASLAESAVAKVPWVGAGVALQAALMAGCTESVTVALTAYGPADLAKAKAPWNGLFWELTADNRVTFWWMIVVQFFDAIESLASQAALDNLAAVFTRSLEMPIVKNADGESYSVASVSTEALGAASMYELAWLRPHLARFFTTGGPLSPAKQSLLASFPSVYFTLAERNQIVGSLLNQAAAKGEWTDAAKRLVLSLDSTILPDQALLERVIAAATSAEAAHADTLIANKLIRQRLQRTSTAAEIVGALVAHHGDRDPIFTWRLLLDWVHLSKSAAAERAAAVAAAIGGAHASVNEDVHSAMLILLRSAAGDAADQVCSALDVDAWMARLLEPGAAMDPLVVRALEVVVAQTPDEAEFTERYQRIVDTPVAQTAGSLANWIVLVHVFSASAHHEHAVRKMLRHTLCRIEAVAASATSLADILAGLDLVQRLLEKIGRMSPRTLSQVLLLVAHLVSATTAARLFEHVAPESISAADREALFMGVVDVLAAMLHHQRRGLMGTPVMFCAMLRDLMLCFLEPGRYARDGGAAAAAAAGKKSTAAASVPAGLPLALLTSLAPYSHVCAWAWHRLVAGISTLSAPALLSLKGASSARLIAPLARHAGHVVAEYALWTAFAVPASHPRFGWAVVTSAKSRAALVRGVYAALDLVGDDGRAAILAAVPAGAKATVKELVADYEKYFKFHGKV